MERENSGASFDSPRIIMESDCVWDGVEKEPLTKNESSDSEENSPMTNIKLSRDPSAAITEYVKHDVFFQSGYLYHPLRVFSVSDRNDPNKIQIKVKNDENGAIHVITNKNFHEYTTIRNIYLFVINYLGRIFELIIPFDVNETFGNFVQEFQKFYDTGSIAVIFKEKRLNSKEVENIKFQQDYDFENDFLVFVIDKFPNDIFKNECVINRTFIQKQTMKTVFVFENNIKVSAFYLARGIYECSQMVIPSFVIFEINENPQKYFSKQKGAKSKNSPLSKCERYAFDSFFKKNFDEKSEDKNVNYKIIHSAKNIKCEHDFEAEEQIKDDSFYGCMRNSFKHYPLPDELTFYKDKIYLIKFDIISESTTRIVKYKKQKISMYSKKGRDLVHIFSEKKPFESVLAGIEYRKFTVFEN